MRKIKNRATERKVGWNIKYIQTPKDKKKLKILETFLNSDDFDCEDRKDINRLVKRNVYWDNPDEDDDHYYDLIDET